MGFAGCDLGDHDICSKLLVYTLTKTLKRQTVSSCQWFSCVYECVYGRGGVGRGVETGDKSRKETLTTDVSRGFKKMLYYVLSTTGKKERGGGGERGEGKRERNREGDRWLSI